MHTKTLHGGNQLTLRLMRQQYWIPNIKNLIRKVIYKCKTCVLEKKRQHTQIMAALPPERVTLSRPFETTGVDFAGPFEVKNYAGRACLIRKGYVCVFVCFSTKAIHLETFRQHIFWLLLLDLVHAEAVPLMSSPTTELTS